MKKILVVVGTLFVLLVLAYLFQQNSLKEGLDLDRGQFNPPAGTPTGISDIDGPGVLTRARGETIEPGQYKAYGKGGNEWPVNYDDNEWQRRNGYDDKSYINANASSDPDERYQAMENARNDALGGPPYTIQDGDGNIWKTETEGQDVGDMNYTYRILNSQGEPTNTIWNPGEMRTSVVPYEPYEPNEMNEMNEGTEADTTVDDTAAGALGDMMA